jgi:hypothetical protein
VARELGHRHGRVPFFSFGICFDNFLGGLRVGVVGMGACARALVHLKKLLPSNNHDRHLTPHPTHYNKQKTL